MKAVWLRYKPFFRWLILGLVALFLAKTLHDHWQEVVTLRVSGAGFACLTIALGITLLGHIAAGWVWSWILQALNQKAAATWGVRIYLQTNLAKYLPGNIWHFYGRISAATHHGIPIEPAIASVLLEPLLMVAAALLMALMGIQQLGSGSWAGNSLGWLQILSLLGLALVLAAVHPRFLNPLVGYLAKLKQKTLGSSTEVTLKMRHYPLKPLLGELGFLGLRGMGFVATLGAIVPLSGPQLPVILGAFALAWLVGFVSPGLPGGVGVFEAVAIALLGQQFSAGDLLSVLALYRLINTLAEVAGAGLVTLDDRG